MMIKKYVLFDKRFLLALFFVNLLGTIYGFIWYKEQLVITPYIYWPFVPDSPIASLFFTIFLLFFMLKKNVPYVEALAVMTLFKYGIWAIIMNLLTLYVDGSLGWQGYMLIISHGLMALQGLLYYSAYSFTLKHIAVAGIWTLHNDVIDYVFGMMPIYASLTKYMESIGYFTFWLSIASIGVSYMVMKNRNQ